ncbi:MAG TPA: carbohydrate-binding protein, partial [Ktedonobacteraceae bacterium]|nr:carbohydrate-binding protein [Ktedonobacteraceae bacterium]
MQGLFASHAPAQAHTPLRWLRGSILLILFTGMVTFVAGGTLLQAHAAGNRYYVATNGSDSNVGTAASPFRTIQHCASVAVAGDTCAVRTGTYHETVTPANSGNSGAPITFKPDDGAKVIIDGADVVTGWTVSSLNSSIYQANVALNPSLFANQVFADGQMLNEARWPRSGSDQLRPTLLTAGLHTDKNTIYDSAITQGKDYWKGATIHYWGRDAYASKTATITSSNVGTLSFQEPYPGTCPALCTELGSRYYITSSLNALTAPGEWYYDPNTQTLYVWMPDGKQPGAQSIEAKQRDLAFDLSGRSYITISGFSIKSSTITTDNTSSYDTITHVNASYVSHFTTIVKPDDSVIVADNYDFAYLGAHEVDTGIILKGSHNTLSSSTIAYSAGNGVSLQGTNNTVTNNIIHDVNYMGTYDSGINILGSGHQITHNTIYEAGRNLISWDWHVAGQTMQNVTIAYNDLFNADLLTQDGGSLYICCQVNLASSSIDHNLIHDEQSSPDHTYYYTAAGLYLDNGTYGGLLHHNVLWDNANTGVILNDQYGSSPSNLVYNNTIGYGQQYALGGSNWADRSGTQIINNIFAVPQGSTYNSTATLSNNIAPPTDPKFVNGAQNNYQLQSGSPAIAAGIDELPYTNDGHTGSAPDLGAYPYGVTPWSAGASNAARILPAPTLLSVQPASNQVTLTWGTVGNATGYKIYYGTSSQSYAHTLDVGSVTTKTLTGLAGGKNYYFAVQAYNSDATSHKSVERTTYVLGGTRPATALTFTSTYDAATAGISTTPFYIGNYVPGDTLEYDNVDFGSGVTTFSASVAIQAPYQGQYIDVRIDSSSGTVIGSLQVPATPDFTTFTTVTIPVSTVTGTHKLFLVARGPRPGDGVANVSWFSFDTHPVLNAFSQIPATSFSAVQGDPQVDCGGACVGHLDGGSWIE